MAEWRAVMVRKGTINDIEEVLDATEAFYNEMMFDTLGCVFERSVAKESYTRAILLPDWFLFLVSEHNNKIDGVFFGIAHDKTLFYKDKKYMQEIVWHSDPELPVYSRSKIQLELLLEADNQRMLKGCTAFYLSTDVRPEFVGLAKYLTKHGFIKMTEYFFKGV